METMTPKKYSIRWLIPDILLFTFLHELGHLIILFLYGGTLYSIFVPEWLSFLVYWDLPLITGYNPSTFWHWTLIVSCLEGFFPNILSFLVSPMLLQLVYAKLRHLPFKWVVPIILISHIRDLNSIYVLVISLL